MALEDNEYAKSRVSSPIFLLFWPVLLVVNALQIRSWVLQGEHHTHTHRFWLFVFHTVIMALTFALELVPKQTTDYESPGDGTDVNPEERANIYSIITFHWMSPLLALGYRTPLTTEDLWPVSKNIRARTTSEKFQGLWERQQQRENPSLFRAILSAFGDRMAFGGFCKFIHDLLAFVQPVLLRHLLDFVSSYETNTPDPAYRGFLISGLMFVSAVTQTAFLQQYFQQMAVVGMNVRTAVSTAIYRKALCLSNTSRQRYTVGEIVNIMSVDSQRFMDVCTFMHLLWSSPLQITLALYNLYYTLGWSVFAGVAVMMLSIPLNAFITSRLRQLQVQQMKNKDQRTKLMDEILNGIKVIKLYAWERSFLKKIFHVRNDLELKTLQKYGVGNAMLNFVINLAPVLVMLSTLGIYALFDAQSHGPLTARLIFVSLSLFNLLGFPLAVFPQVITMVVEASVSLSRVHAFLTSEELGKWSVWRLAMPKGEDGATSRDEKDMVVVRNGVFNWDNEDLGAVLDGIDFSCDHGTLLAVVGRVGAGKSSLLSALLGDMVKVGGDVTIKGKVAYAPQQPWIMNATLRENITFGHDYDPDFYEKTIEACALRQDIEMLPGGDQTEIGEKGINLSGGQKARVSLARAVYAMADVYLLDDTLSAVDSHVGRHIFDKVIGPQGILKNRTRIFVTHALQYIRSADRIMMLRRGQIAELGSYDMLMEKQGELHALVSEFVVEEKEREEEKKRTSTAAAEEPSIDMLMARSFGAHSAITTGSTEGDSGGNDDDIRPVTQPLHRASTSETFASLRRSSVASGSSEDWDQRRMGAGTDALMTIERSAKGRVSGKVYAAYLRACSVRNVVLLLVMATIVQLGNIASSMWLKYWSDYNEEHPTNHDAAYFLTVYAIVGVGTAIILMLQMFVLYVFCAYRSAKVTHEATLLGVIRSPMSFFDTTPLGRILNRFSKDQVTVDESLPRSFYSFIRTGYQVLGVIGIISYSSPGFMLVVVPLAVVYTYVQRYYLETSRELKRLDSVSRSPVFAHFQETLGGVATIRAYRQNHRFIKENRWRIDENLRAYYPWISLNRWLAVRLETVGNANMPPASGSIVILSASSMAVVTTITTGNTTAGLVGLSVTYALSVTQSLNWCVRMSCEIETNIVSMERLHEYAELPSEAPEIIEGKRPSPAWPARGAIKFENYQTRYREGLDLVLKGITFDVKPREKVGIVGRTGAGKSSLTLALFRLIEAANGSITIDGEDIGKIGLYDLRSRLTIIPQDPVLFAGTVRSNLDPFGTHDDVEIWNVLRSAHLKDHVSGLEDKLNAAVLQGGENFSVGQRQLLCLARALLRRSSILILDEATAAIDVETDKAIQETIRREFKNCTILTIAHRINTVMDSDRILVLEQGQIAEYDSPSSLLQKPESIFYGLAKESGLA
ncbi:multi drug resistance-associated protein MRP [Thamnocephalis sphaerospora]|uniref:Multi drug resistance-associated protein MRP n=1 Tax=Thamnocephalis sphaerospora TaxID=78915 RepID=A0A4V1IXC5_9FUNG|nr:multi drug resistance-associated protein MRP [Thamnocephalis sphaerospora]|eukprot:RKP10579.1 multi drug resistance-associated protein MRP [Thamnocephalis sphaerospora]